MNKYIEKLKNIPFSGGDILECVDDETKIIRYPDIHKYNKIEDLLKPFNSVVILYETKHKYGHWVCVILHNNGILEFFDPYGYFIDDQLKFINKEFRNKTNQEYPFLSRLFLNSPYKIIYNNKRLQKFYKNNSSCGRHVALRLILKDIPLNYYQKIMGNEGKLTPDDKATYFTAFIK